MRKIRKIGLLAVLLLAGCAKDASVSSIESGENGFSDKLPHEMIVLGDKLEDPYSVTNVTKALEALYPTKASRVDITPTDLYVRFLPATEEEYDSLVDLGLELIDHPLDYQIVKEGDYYHDPGVSEDKITWQYAVVSKDFELPEGIRHEVLDRCYIADDTSTRADGIDWDAVEREAFRLTGNADLLVPETKGGKVHPSGRITIVDEAVNGGKPFGVAGVKVVCNVFVKFCTKHTDRDGYYTMPKKYSSRPRYRLLFANTKKFNIGFNKILIPASWSSLGKGDPSGMDATISKASGKKLFARCCVNNAGYDYISRCEENELNIAKPPKKLRVWIFYNMKASSAVMLKHGAILDNAVIAKFLGVYATIAKIFLPDITLGVEDAKHDYATIYSKACHEFAHASHFTQVGHDYWDKYILYIITSFISSGGVTYGDGTGGNAGICEVGEMWGYFMQAVMYRERYGGELPSVGMNFWFKPQIFRYLYERGMTCSQIFSAIGKDVTSRDKLRERLIELYPEQQEMIELAFRRYADSTQK